MGWRSIVCLGGLTAVIVSCVIAASVRVNDPVRLKPDATTDFDPSKACETQAARMAAWRGRGPIGAPVQEPAWLGHYSVRDDVCYALIAGKAAVTNGEAPPLVTELWNAFEATLLATSTSDGRAEMRRDFCRIDLAEKPFTSCLVSEFFIRQHLAN
jgi:hypothetical protein